MQTSGWVQQMTQWFFKKWWACMLRLFSLYHTFINANTRKMYYSKSAVFKIHRKRWDFCIQFSTNISIRKSKWSYSIVKPNRAQIFVTSIYIRVQRRTQDNRETLSQSDTEGHTSSAIRNTWLPSHSLHCQKSYRKTLYQGSIRKTETVPCVPNMKVFNTGN